MGTSADAGADRLRVLEVDVGDRRYGVEIGRVAAVVKPPDAARVPRTPEHVAGVARLRGETTVVLDGRVLFDATGTPPADAAARTVVFDRGDGTPLGLTVDAVGETRSHHVDGVGPASAALALAEVTDAETPLTVIDVDAVADTVTERPSASA